MRAIDALKELHEHDNSIVAIAKEINGEVYYYTGQNPKWDNSFKTWTNGCLDFGILMYEIDFESENIEECIATIDCSVNYEVKMMSISVSKYNHLIECEKRLNEIKSLFL